MSNTFQPNIFHNKVVFSTGGRSGISYAIVKKMLLLGCKAAIVGREFVHLLYAVPLSFKPDVLYTAPTPFKKRQKSLVGTQDRSVSLVRRMSEIQSG